MASNPRHRQSVHDLKPCIRDRYRVTIIDYKTLSPKPSSLSYRAYALASRAYKMIQWLEPGQVLCTKAFPSDVPIAKLRDTCRKALYRLQAEQGQFAMLERVTLDNGTIGFHRVR